MRPPVATASVTRVCSSRSTPASVTILSATYFSASTSKLMPQRGRLSSQLTDPPKACMRSVISLRRPSTMGRLLSWAV